MRIKGKLRDFKAIYYSLVALFLVASCTVPVSTSRHTTFSETSSPAVQTHSERANLPPLEGDKKRLYVSHPIQDSLTVALPPFSLKGEVQDDVSFSPPLTLPISRSNIQEGTGEIHLSGGTESWNADQLVTASFSLYPQSDGTIDMRLNAGKSSGPMTYYISASGSTSGNSQLTEGDVLIADLDTGSSQYSISHDNTGNAGTYKFESGQIQAHLSGGQLTVSISGMTSSQLTKFDCYSWGTGSACYDVSNTSKKLLGGQISFVVPINTQSLALALKASQDVIGNLTSDTDGNLLTHSVISIDPFDSQKPWTLRVKKEGTEGTATGSTCWESYTSSGTGKSDNALTLDAAKLGNGIYTAEAYYTDYPDEKATVTVEIKNNVELKVIGNSTFMPPDEEVTLQASYPACSEGHVVLEGAIQKVFEDVDSESARCNLSVLETGNITAPQTLNFTWNGVCEENYGRDLWTADLWLDGSIEDTKTLELLGDLPSCEDTPLMPEDLNEMLSLINQLSLFPNTGFGIQSVDVASGDALKTFVHQKSKMQKAYTKLAELGYPVAQIQETSTQDALPATSSFPKAKPIERQLNAYFEAKAQRNIAKTQYKTFLNGLETEIVALKTYSQSSFGIPFEDYSGEQRTPSILFYKDLVDDAVADTQLFLSEKTVPDLLLSMQTYTNLLSIFYELSHKYLDGEVSALEGVDAYDYEKLNPEKLNTPHQLIKYIQRTLKNLNEKINSRHQTLNEELSQLFVEAEELSDTLDQLEAEAEAIDQSDAELLEEWKALLNEIAQEESNGDFSVQSIENPTPDAGLPNGYYGRGNIPGSTTNYARNYYSKSGRPVRPEKIQRVQLNKSRSIDMVSFRQGVLINQRANLSRVNTQISRYEKGIKQAKKTGNIQLQQRLELAKQRAERQRAKFKDNIQRNTKLLKKAKAAAKKAQKQNLTLENTQSCSDLSALTNGEIKILNRNGIDPHYYKPNARYDLYKDRKGNVFFVRKGNPRGSEPQPLHINIKELK